MKEDAILVTGGAGFIGSNFIHFITKLNLGLKVINLDALTYAADIANLDFIDSANYTFIEGDIRDNILVSKIFNDYNVMKVVHFAAESHVDNSIESPRTFIETNIVGTFNLLNTAYKQWMEKPFKFKEGSKDCVFLHVSTDEVYGSLGNSDLFTESSPYAPNSPYSASKASSDLLVRSYFHTYGLNTLITNCSNNYGPRQHDEKLIPTVIKNAINQRDIPVYGKGLNIRDWLFVDDHCSAIWEVIKKGRFGETYNIGSSNERKNIEIVETICEILNQKKPLSKGKYSDFIKFVDDRPGHDWRYAIDSSKLMNETEWKAGTDFLVGLEKTVDWYLDKYLQ